MILQTPFCWSVCPKVSSHFLLQVINLIWPVSSHQPCPSAKFSYRLLSPSDPALVQNPCCSLSRRSLLPGFSKDAPNLPLLVSLVLVKKPVPGSLPGSLWSIAPGTFLQHQPGHLTLLLEAHLRFQSSDFLAVHRRRESISIPTHQNPKSLLLAVVSSP